MTTVFPIIGFFTLVGLLYSEKTGNMRLKWLFKPVTSLLFVLTAAVGGIEDRYAILVLLGLALGMVGDIVLIPPSRPAFMVGAGAFLLGHVLYILAFNDVISMLKLNPVLIVILLGVGAGIFFALRPKLGDMRSLVAAYILTISLMLWAALAIFFESSAAQTFQNLTAAGAICFYLSDLGVALDRFVKTPFKNAYWSLPLYYAGQFMIALTTAAR